MSIKAAIETRYVAPRFKKPAHILATNLETGACISHPYMPEIGLYESHFLAASELGQNAGWFVETTTKWRGLVPAKTKRGLVWVRVFADAANISPMP